MLVAGFIILLIVAFALLFAAGSIPSIGSILPKCNPSDGCHAKGSGVMLTSEHDLAVLIGVIMLTIVVTIVVVVVRDYVKNHMNQDYVRTVRKPEGWLD